MEMHMETLVNLLASLQPALTLDVGCGCGEFARSLAPRCDKLVGIDVSASLGSRWRRPAAGGDIVFYRMDARRMGFPSATFPVVFERESLHHVADWEAVLDEMFRVSRTWVILEEPVDDPRSAVKRNTIEAQDLFLELQHEVGFSHFRHLDPAVLLSAVARRGTVRRSEIHRTDDLVPAEEYFAGFSRFAGQSRRPQYWESRLQSFLGEVEDGVLCQSDSLVVLAEVTA
jgi:SAM-dependent methyltransferase